MVKRNISIKLLYYLVPQSFCFIFLFVFLWIILVIFWCLVIIIINNSIHLVRDIVTKELQLDGYRNKVRL